MQGHFIIRKAKMNCPKMWENVRKGKSIFAVNFSLENIIFDFGSSRGVSFFFLNVFLISSFVLCHVLASYPRKKRWLDILKIIYCTCRNIRRIESFPYFYPRKWNMKGGQLHCFYWSYRHWIKKLYLFPHFLNVMVGNFKNFHLYF
jgi:hypothetical protein